MPSKRTVRTNRTLHLEIHRENAVNVVGVKQQLEVEKRAIDLYNCNVMLEGDRFRSTSTGSVYERRKPIDCRSKNIIYLVTCKRCRMQGVGSTLDFQGGVSDYITHMYKEKDTCEIVEHFLKQEDHSLWDFSIMGIVQIENPPRNRGKLQQRLRELESY